MMVLNFVNPLKGGEKVKHNNNTALILLIGATKTKENLPYVWLNKIWDLELELDLKLKSMDLKSHFGVWHKN